jgi:hypothetical protein
MSVLTLRTAAMALVAGLGLGGCAYGPYGGLGVGYGNNGYYDPYYNGGYSGYGGYGGYGGSGGYGYGAGYSPYGYGYGQPYYGWNNGFYYPGTGYYVYDRHRNRHQWTDAQRRYWESRRERYNRGDSGTNGIIQNWADFQNGQQSVRQQSVATNRTISSRDITTQQQINAERVRARSEAQQARSQARSERQSVRNEARQNRRGLRVRNSGVDNE